MFRRVYFIFLLLLCSRIAMGQTLTELENQLDSLLRRKAKSELVAAVGYGNNPAYGSKTTNYEWPIVMKTFLSPSLTYYHKSGFYGGASSYYLVNANERPWFEWDLTAGYDYTKSDKILTGISYTKYFFTDSSDVPRTPITNEIFAYFYYRKWWLEPGISVDYGWGKHDASGEHTHSSLKGNDFNTVLAVRHPFLFNGVLSGTDALLLAPSIGFTWGTANYFSNLKTFQYITRSPKLKKTTVHRGKEVALEDHSGFEPRALDLTLNFSYLIGKLNIAPAFTVFKPFTGTDQRIMSYFTARIEYSF